MDIEQAKKILQKYGQEHILKYYGELSEQERAALLADIEGTDFSVIEQSRGQKHTAGKITPLSAMEIPEIEKSKEDFRKKGIEAIRDGKVAAVLLAGGMGTRLGANGPKGIYDIGVTKPVYIFQRLFENMLDVVREVGEHFPLFIMTSEVNHDSTVNFLTEKKFFGYDPDYVVFFKQDKAPATDYEGKIFMESKSRLATSPNGNGGWFSSLMRSPAYEKLTSDDPKWNRVEWMNIFAVDNVLQRICDPVFIGATLSSGRRCGAKVVRKASRNEKVGVMCLEDGRPSIVEYYELTDEMADTKNEKGEPAYNFGVILNYLFNLDDLRKTADKNMPLHVVEKKIPHIDEAGNLIKPESPNGYKYETLALDLVRMMDSCLPFEVVRDHEFAPVKNPTGIDSVESARELCRKNGIEL